MEDKEGPTLGVTVKGDEGLDGFHVASYVGPTVPSIVARPPSMVVPPGQGTGSEMMKKKRGRPRKYAPDGSLAITLSPMPISASIPMNGDFPGWNQGRAQPVGTFIKKSLNYELETNPDAIKMLIKDLLIHFCFTNLNTCLYIGDKIAYFVGTNFTPHVITVNAGEDVSMKVMFLSQQGAHAICVLSANGTISNVTLRQPTSSGGTLTYEGHFEILSLSGSYMPTNNGGTKSMSGGMSISLAGPDGRVLGGGLAGLLVAAGPVQVVVGSFLPSNKQEQKHKKQRIEPTVTIVSPTATHSMPADINVSYGGIKPILTYSFQGDNSGSLNPIQSYRNSSIDNNSPSAENESNSRSLSQCQVSS
ncbi:AT-hook motif nuclear-localized protein 6-like [Gossypium australe]|uniref:AT-hook motif nuclear-localized protein n=1 Tax=Gossypium australe TaxID=47621 RepID=A0A5B6UNX9_9ROSI|nr:AT-hook motif nuclear-localized protein 6-like [Gossypium australe]